jgi:hypothetical protein
MKKTVANCHGLRLLHDLGLTRSERPTERRQLPQPPPPAALGVAEPACLLWRVRSAPSTFAEVYAHVIPFEHKEAIQLVLRRAEDSVRQIVPGLCGTLTPEMVVPDNN